MPITFNSSGGFLNGTISSSNGDLFITTSGSVGKITLGNTEYTGSEVIEKDASGNVRNKKIFNSDGTTTLQKFDASEKIIETKIKNPSSGKEIIQSASATDNQIEFQQASTGAFITVSGSSPGYNIIETSGDKDFRLIRAISDVLIKDSVNAFSTGINSNNEYEISANMSFGGIGLKVSNTGDVNVSGGITATSLNVTHFTSSFVTSSTITTEGNTIFGDTDSDSHTFNGHITASGNISGSSTSTINVGGNITTNDSFLGQKLILGTVDTTDNTYLSASDGNVIIAGDNGSSGDVSLTIQNTDQSTSTGQTTTLQFMQQAQNAGKIVGGKDNVFVFGSAQNDSNMQFHTTLDGTDTERMRITSAGLVGIGNSSPTKTLTVNGEISASSTITSKTGFVGETQNTGSYDFPGAIMGYNVDGHNSAHNSVSLTTSFAVPDDRLHVCFVAPKSGIVEIEAQVRLNMGSSTGAFFYLGLSDAATYNSVAAYYEQVVCDPDENDDVAITHKWVVPSLTPGTTYKYWLGAKVSSTSGTPTIVWGGSSSLRFSDFMMKATALPSNTDIQ